MFRKNEQRQKSLFGPETILNPRLLAQLQASWARTFREEVFERINEDSFAPLYSEKDSRPNAPVNVLVAFDIIKAGQGWTDEELYEGLCFDVRLRYAVGIEDIGVELPFTLRTLYNFRSRVRAYEKREGVNLYEKVFEQVTDEQLERYRVAAGLQRMDSTQVLSNVAQSGRLALLISVLQQGIKGLGEENRQTWRAKAKIYLGKRPHEVVFGVKQEEMEAHFQALGTLLVALRDALAADSVAYALVERVLKEQYKEEAGTWVLRPAREVSADSLQSPHDVEATFRVKNGQAYPGGYVVNVSETCDAENALQLITDIQVAPNVTDDGELLRRSVDKQSERGLEVKDIVTDGGYNGPDTEEFCKKNAITHRPTNIRGGKSAKDRLGWEMYQWQLNKEGIPVAVVCPRGQKGQIRPGRKEGRWLVRFADASTCQTCPLLDQCRVVLQKRNGPAMRVTTRSIQVALLRQRLCPEDRSLRSPVEATVRSLKWGLRKDKLPVRGQVAAVMYFTTVALMVNLRRIHAYLVESEGFSDTTAAFVALIYWLLAKIRLLQRRQTNSAAMPGPRAYFRFFFESVALSLFSPAMEML